MGIFKKVKKENSVQVQDELANGIINKTVNALRTESDGINKRIGDGVHELLTSSLNEAQEVRNGIIKVGEQILSGEKISRGGIKKVKLGDVVDGLIKEFGIDETVRRFKCKDTSLFDKIANEVDV